MNTRRYVMSDFEIVFEHPNSLWLQTEERENCARDAKTHVQLRLKYNTNRNCSITSYFTTLYQ